MCPDAGGGRAAGAGEMRRRASTRTKKKISSTRRRPASALRRMIHQAARSGLVGASNPLPHGDRFRRPSDATTSRTSALTSAGRRKPRPVAWGRWPSPRAIASASARRPTCAWPRTRPRTSCSSTRLEPAGQRRPRRRPLGASCRSRRRCRGWRSLGGAAARPRSPGPGAPATPAGRGLATPRCSGRSRRDRSRAVRAAADGPTGP